MHDGGADGPMANGAAQHQQQRAQYHAAAPAHHTVDPSFLGAKRWQVSGQLQGAGRRGQRGTGATSPPAQRVTDMVARPQREQGSQLGG